MATSFYLPPRTEWTPAARRLRDTYARVPGAPLYHCEELGYFSLDRWAEQGMPADAERNALFWLDSGGYYHAVRKGYHPEFETKVLEDRGEYELVQDSAGRHVVFFKGRRNGFMPEYETFPVTDRRSWEEKVKWRLDPHSPGRYTDLPQQIAKAQAAIAEGAMIRAYSGGYAFLRNMVGTIGVLYAFYDIPDVIHEIMEAWLGMTDAALAAYQQYVTLDELFFGEDICFKTGSFISESMFREFLLPYYQQVVQNARARQRDRSRTLHVHIDSDGHVEQVIPWYREMGMTVMSPFEVAADNDMLAFSRQYSDLVMWGGIDKRVLAQTPQDIDDMLQRVVAPMRGRGGYVPCCDHGVPEEVPYTNYLHYRRRCVEMGG
jgi:uroporphyrinogen decarboxylase